MPSVFLHKGSDRLSLFLVSNRSDAGSGPTRAGAARMGTGRLSLIAFFLSTLRTPSRHFGKKRRRATGSILKSNNVILDENAFEEIKEFVIHISEKEIKTQGNGVS